MATLFLAAILAVLVVTLIELTLFIYWLMRVSGVELPEITAPWQKAKDEVVVTKKEVPIEQFVPDPNKELTLLFEESNEGHGVSEVKAGDNV